MPISRLDLETLQPLLDRIVKRWSPTEVWLFGSRARGDARASSDWDLLVVVPDDVDDADFDPLIGWRLQRDARIRADIFPCRATDFREDMTTVNTLAYDAAIEGVRVYER